MTGAQNAQHAKAVLRLEMRRRRREYVDANASRLLALHSALADLFFERLPRPALLGSYWAVGAEVNPALIVDHARRYGVRIALPRIRQADVPLDYAESGGSPLIAGAHNIPAPSLDQPTVFPDVLLVPLLAVDPRGYRLGQGKGYYDRTLAYLRRRGGVIAVGLAYDIQLVEQTPADTHDEPLDFVATPSRWLRCGPAGGRRTPG